MPDDFLVLNSQDMISAQIRFGLGPGFSRTVPLPATQGAGPVTRLPRLSPHLHATCSGVGGVEPGASPSRRLQVHPLDLQGRAAVIIQTQPWLSVCQGEARGVCSIPRCSRTI